MAREPFVSGIFYESDASALAKQVRFLLGAELLEASAGESAVACLVPHAGYAYSGKVAGQTYSRIRVPDRVVILAPNHTGLGRIVSVGLDSPWETPLGPVEVDRDLALRLVASSPALATDDLAHVEEHAIEVHLPFLQVRNPRVRIVPICLRILPLPACEEIARTLTAVLSELREPVLIVASSDLNHHEPLAVAARKDRLILERLRELDARGLYQAVTAHHISMCGFVPATIALIAATGLGASHTEVVAYATSADVDGDESSVVGYAGVVFTCVKPPARHGFLTGCDQPKPRSR